MITSRDNEKLKLIRRLGERKHRVREGLFVAEGKDLIAAAEAGGVDPVFVLRRGIDVEPRLLDAVSALGSGAEVIGVYPRVSGPGGRGLRVYLHGVGDPGNVGAILRTTHALAADATVVLGPGCADPYSPKAVRASMGSIFGQRLAEGGLESLPAPIVGLAAHGGREPDGHPAASLCLGSEREGLPRQVHEACDRLWTIPLSAGGAESLNVAAAAAIALGWISSAARAGDAIEDAKG